LPVVDRSGLPGLNGRAVAIVAAALLAPASVAVLRLFPPLSLSDPGAPSWLGPTVAGLASLAVGVAAALAMAAGLRRSTLGPLVEAAGLGALAAGLAAGIFHAMSHPASFPDGGLPIAALVAGAGLLVSRLVSKVRLDTHARRVTVVGVAVVIEVALAVALFAPVEPAVAPWLTASGAAMAADLVALPDPPPIVMLHGVRHASDLAYRAQIAAWATDTPQLTYLPAVSRPEPGRLEPGLLPGRALDILPGIWPRLRIGPASVVAYLCGNPSVVNGAAEWLANRGLAEDAIQREEYWPAT